MQRPSLLAWILLIILALIWGSSFILIKKGLVGLSSQEVGSLRIVAAFIFMLPAGIKRFKSVRGQKKMPYLLLAGLLGSLIPSLLFATAQTELESSVTGVLNALTPIFTILIAFLIFKQKQSRTVFFGVMVGFLGTAILITAGEKGGMSSINGVAFLVVLATICYASNLNLIKRYLNEINAVTVTSVSLLLVGPIASIHLFGFTDFMEKLSGGGDVYLPILYICILGVLGTAIALVIFNKMLQMTTPLFASSVTYIIPMIAVVWGVLDGEQLYLMHYVGMLAVGLGVYIANSNRAAYKKDGKIK
ncbi:MAG: DMT family transporter [Bacteroidota bacterium]